MFGKRRARLRVLVRSMTVVLALVLVASSVEAVVGPERTSRMSRHRRSGPPGPVHRRHVSMDSAISWWADACVPGGRTPEFRVDGQTGVLV